MVPAAATPPESTDAAVETLLAFVNTRFRKGTHVERFDDVEDFTAWAREQGAIDDDEKVGDPELRAARELRSALVAVMMAHADHPEHTEEQLEEAERHLEKAAALYPVQVTLTADGSKVAGQDRGAAGLFGTVLAAANEIAQHDDWWRMKACASPPCRHGLVDRTKNGSQRFCSSTCSSRAAMRAMRDRRRDDDA